MENSEEESSWLLSILRFTQNLLGDFASVQILWLHSMLRVYTPLLLKVLTVTLAFLPAPPEIIIENSSTESSEVSETHINVYSSFIDDRASNTDISDLERLKKHGYDKYRYVSMHFIKRNGGVDPAEKLIEAVDMIKVEEEDPNEMTTKSNHKKITNRKNRKVGSRNNKLQFATGKKRRAALVHSQNEEDS